MPFWCLYLLSDFIFLVTYHIIGYRRKVVLTNLTIAFPDKSDEELNDISRRFYAHFCDLFLETIKLLSVTPVEIRSRIDIKGLERIQSHLKEGRNILLYASHQGNWEWLTLFPLFIETEASTFYKPLKNQYFNDLFLLIRERFGVKCLPHGNGFKTLLTLQNKNINFMSCLIGDQNPTQMSSKKTIDFFNHQTDFFDGTSRVAQKIDAVVFFPFFKKLKRGYYELHFEMLGNDGRTYYQKLLEDYGFFLERVIEQGPELYLWTHKRWKRNGVHYQ